MKKEILMTACVLAAAVSLTACSPAMLAALGASASSTQQVWPIISQSTTPGTTGFPGKWPCRNHSSPRTV